MKLTAEIVSIIRDSPESNGALARRFGVAKQTISKVRKGLIHRIPDSEDEARAGRVRMMQHEAVVRAILSRSPDVPHMVVAADLGIHRDTVRKVRYGLQWSNVLPDLERLDPDQAGARCWACVQWTGDRCGLGIPECATEGHTWARGCGAFSQGR